MASTDPLEDVASFGVSWGIPTDPLEEVKIFVNQIELLQEVKIFDT